MTFPQGSFLPMTLTAHCKYVTLTSFGRPWIAVVVLICQHRLHHCGKFHWPSPGASVVQTGQPYRTYAISPWRPGTTIVVHSGPDHSPIQIFNGSVLIVAYAWVTWSNVRLLPAAWRMLRSIWGHRICQVMESIYLHPKKFSLHGFVPPRRISWYPKQQLHNPSRAQQVSHTCVCKRCGIICWCWSISMWLFPVLCLQI